MPSPNIRIIYRRLLSGAVWLKPAPAGRLPAVVLQFAETAQPWCGDAEKKTQNIEHRMSNIEQQITTHERQIHFLFTLQEHPALLKSCSGSTVKRFTVSTRNTIYAIRNTKNGWQNSY